MERVLYALVIVLLPVIARALRPRPALLPAGPAATVPAATVLAVSAAVSSVGAGR
ncbi:hypothetical protein ACFQV8_21705 [Pseudonocardia benzenivorans]